MSEFRIVCGKCGSLKIKIVNSEGASRDEIVYCGNCGTSRGTMGALRDLAFTFDTRAPLLAGRKKRKLPSEILQHFREIQRFRRQESRRQGRLGSQDHSRIPLTIRTRSIGIDRGGSLPGRLTAIEVPASGNRSMIARFAQVGTLVSTPGAWNHGRFSVDGGAWTMIEDGFDARTLANMNVALERACRQSANGEDYNVRKLVAEGIIQCAKEGRKTLGALTQAGERVLTDLPTTRAGSP